MCIHFCKLLSLPPDEPICATAPPPGPNTHADACFWHCLLKLCLPCKVGAGTSPPPPHLPPLLLTPHSRYRSQTLKVSHSHPTPIAAPHPQIKMCGLLWLPMCSRSGSPTVTSSAMRMVLSNTCCPRKLDAAHPRHLHMLPICT